MADSIKLVLAALIFVAGVAGFYFLGQQSDVVRVLIVLVAAGVGIAVGAQTALGRSLVEFIKASRAELRKVVWPSNKETMQMTLVVFGMVVLIAVFLWVVDWGLLKFMQALTGHRI